jgi:hypothetical protein
MTDTAWVAAIDHQGAAQVMSVAMWSVHFPDLLLLPKPDATNIRTYNDATAAAWAYNVKRRAKPGSRVGVQP